MTKYKIAHDRPNCIGCGACANLCSQNWSMNADGKSDVKKDKISEEEYAANKAAADACPVNVIHIINEETDEKII